MGEKIVLIGAGSANFGLEAVSDIYRSKTLEGSHIVLHDTDEKSLKETQDVADKYKGEFGVNFTVTSSIDRKEALKFALTNLKSDEILIIFGKGTEEYQEINGTKHFYSDSDIIKEFYEN